MEWSFYYILSAKLFSSLILTLSSSIASSISPSAVDWFCDTSFILYNPVSIPFIPLEISFIILSILLMDSFDVSESFLISSATTANPRPYSPALAASIDALSPKRLVWEDLSWTIVFFSSMDVLILST